LHGFVLAYCKTNRRQTVITLWGRANSINVQKVIWALAELEMPYTRIDAGMQFGVVNTPEFLAMNPNGLVPVLRDGDFTLWESHAILRYLATKDPQSRLLSKDPAQAARADQWLEWYGSTLWPNMRPVFWNLVRTAPEQRDMAAVGQGVAGLGKNMLLLDQHLQTRPYVAGGTFSLGDIPLALIAHRWYAMDIERPAVQAVSAWFERVSARPAFQAHCAAPLT